MAENNSGEGSSTRNASDGTTVQLNIKTLDSRIHTFNVDKKMPVSAFKQKIANEIGVPVGQQRLIFQGRVLKDEHLLSEYQVENGHTLHLVERQPAQQQSSADAASRGVTAGIDTTTGIPPQRIGQISHSVVLGTFNVGDQGEGIAPDVTRVIGAVLNSLGIGGQTAATGNVQSSTSPNVTPSGDGRGQHTNSQSGNQTDPGQAFPRVSFQSPPEVGQIPLPTSTPLPSFSSPIPDSLTTLAEFMTRMERALSQNGSQPNASTTSSGDAPRLELPSDLRGLPTPEALSRIMRQAGRLLNAHAIPALSHIAGRLEQEGASTDLAVRGNIQTQSVQTGLAMQHFGALLLELGRTILTLRMGQSPAQAAVNAGPAVYISSSGPNPIMAQPFPLQINSLFGGPVSQSNPSTFGAVGFGNHPRHVNIHIHAGTSLAPVASAIGGRASMGEGTQGDRGSAVASVGLGSTRLLPARNILATSVPSRSTGVATSHPRPPTDSASSSADLSAQIAELNALLGNMPNPATTQGENLAASGVVSSDSSGIATSCTLQPADSLSQPADTSLVGTASETEAEKDEGVQGSKNEGSSHSADHSIRDTLNLEETHASASTSSEKHDAQEGAKAVPLGLGLSGLERKKSKPLVRGSGSGTPVASSDQNVNTSMVGQQLLQSLASRSSAGNTETPSGHIPNVGVGTLNNKVALEQGSHGQFDATGAMSQVLQSPALDNLLTGVSEQTGVGSPNLLRNMLQQVTRDPQIMSTVSQIAQQVDRHEFANMFPGVLDGGGGQGSSFDMSRMFQQMMPIVSQVLGQGSATSQLFPTSRSDALPQYRSQSREAEILSDENFQGGVHEVARRIEQSRPAGDIFQGVVESAVGLTGSGSGSRDVLLELSNNEDLASDYMEMLRRDLQRRFDDKS